MKKEMSYKYKDVDLQKAIIEKLIIQLFTGKTVQNKQITKNICDYHMENGGRIQAKYDVEKAIIKALAALHKKSPLKVEKLARGLWKFNDEIPEIEKKSKKGSALLEPKVVPNLVNIGRVYLYFDQATKNDAKRKKKEYWDCKIGKTGQLVHGRILSQAKTAFSKMPINALTIETDFPHELEKAIHSILTLRGKRTPNSLGREWFTTNPEEVKRIVEFINPKLKVICIDG